MTKASFLTELTRGYAAAALPEGTHVVLAVSGGPDSIALLHGSARLAHKLGLRFSAVGVDHGLRPEAAAELTLAADLAAANGIEFFIVSITLTRGGNLQARARSARYAAMRAKKIQLGADFLATAHHADDRAETVLMRILRGAPIAGLDVLRPREGDLLRPLSRTPKRAILEHLVRHDVPFARDPSNHDPRYLRTRIRHEVLPLLTQLDPQIAQHLCALADSAAVDASGPRLELLETTAGSDLTTLPQPTQKALRALMQSKSVKARIWLPGERIARFDPDQGLVIESQVINSRPKSHPKI